MKVILIKLKHVIIAISLILTICIIISTQKNNILTAIFNYNIEEPIRNGDTSLNKMAFTCNVDWGSEYIPKLLDILDNSNIKITFFVSGKWAQKNPELLKMMFERGHEIGNHGYSHKMHSKIEKQANYEEIKKTEDSIYEVIGIRTKLFAPPSGDYNQTTIAVASEMGYKTILWSIDTIDWRDGSTSSIIIDRVMKKSHKGAILLMHPKKATIEALPAIIEKITGKGIQIGTVSYLLE